MKIIKKYENTQFKSQITLCLKSIIYNYTMLYTGYMHNVRLNIIKFFNQVELYEEEW